MLKYILEMFVFLVQFHLQRFDGFCFFSRWSHFNFYLSLSNSLTFSLPLYLFLSTCLSGSVRWSAGCRVQTSNLRTEKECEIEINEFRKMTWKN